MKIELYYNNAYKWFSDSKNYVIGYIYYENEFYEENTLLELINKIESKDLKKFLNKIDGAYTFIINRGEEWFIVSDIMRTFPLFYKVSNNSIYICDDIMRFNEKVLSLDNEKELLSCGYVIGDKTLFNDVYQLEGHQIITFSIKSKKIKKENYFDYKYNIKSNSEKTLIKNLDKEYNDMTLKMIKFLKGRTAVIPLSGGNDSRLLAYYLKKNNYNNIITYTYGSPYNSEVLTSKKVADYLGVEWHFVEYKNNSMQKKFNNKKTYKEMANYCGRGFSTPIMQEWEAVSILSEEGIINKDNCILVPGYSGDFVVGSHITPTLYNNEELTYSQLISHIISMQYQYASNEVLSSQKLEKLLKNHFNIKNVKQKIVKQDAIELYEKFDFEERQKKYITNAIRTYDFQGFKWYLPFWDINLIKFCLTIPFEHKYKISLFNKFTMSVYGDLMEYAPIYKMEDTKKITSPFKIIKKIYRICEIYKKGFLNFYGYLYFRTYIKYFLKTKNYKYNKIFAQYYIDYLKKEVK